MELKIIGFYVDINRGTLTLTDEAIVDVVNTVRTFLGTSGRRPSLRKWLRIGRHLNWVFNVLPLGRPALVHWPWSGSVRPKAEPEPKKNGKKWLKTLIL